MSLFSIKEYQSEVEKIAHFGGTKKETAIRNAFYNLLNEYAKAVGLMIVPEIAIKAANSNKSVIPDGTLKDTLRQDWGYWESKDESDDINEEIKKKFEKGYPKENILFEDSNTAVLIQSGTEVQRVSMKDAEALHKLITSFVLFERPEVKNFRKAIELFKQDIPKVTETLRKIIDTAEKNNPAYKKASSVFLKLCHDSINPDVTNADVREMIIQHILTEDVFNTIFDENQFHRENNIARELESVIHTFFTGSIRKTALSSIQHYYQAINAAAAGIADHHEKQKFLKVIYETFYKSYNPKAADRLGVVYTPNEIVKFMIKSTNYLLHKHFNKFLEDKGVEILDPATGTGTFICDIIDSISKDKLEYKYKNELHANEVAILPYYISNLNIEFTFTQKTGKYSEFENLCFVDTLDNMGFQYRGKQTDLFAPFTEENSKRIKKQNSKKISVVIGNPPYNANQLNENENNKNREYPEIDKRIKETYIKYSTAQKTKLYDMYARFLRWAMDRIDDNGIIAFVSNNSFIDSRTYDGFRKIVSDEFNHCYIFNLKGNARTSGERRRQEGGNIFLDQIRVGVAIYYFVKVKGSKNCIINYDEVQDYAKAEEKLQWVSEKDISKNAFTHIIPDKSNNWINIADNDFESLIPIADKAVKLGKSKKALFELFSLGVVTNRDEWVYDFDSKNLDQKIKFLIEVYNKDLIKLKGTNKNLLKDVVDYSIKWTRAVKNDLSKGKEYRFKSDKKIKSIYRPFVIKNLYFSSELNEMQYLMKRVFGKEGLNENLVIYLSGAPASKPFACIATNIIAGLDFIEKTQCLPLYRYDESGNQEENLSDWGLNQFVKHYGKKGITKEQIFYYTYAVLNFPSYRLKYQMNLKRNFPRIPFYENFNKWVNWGKLLVELHANFEKAEKYKLNIVETGKKENPKCKLKAIFNLNEIILDENTSLTGIPVEAWGYKLGNRSALEWVLDQYKETKLKDPTIAEKFNTYKFADYKEQVIDLLKRVCTVSVETMKIIQQMNHIN